MKKRFLPFMMAVLVLGQFAIADNGGHYVPRTQSTMNAENFMGSLRANQNTGLIDPADMFRAMQASATRNAADDPLYWISMGPDNMGGQTTAILYDNTPNAQGNPNGVVYIGSMGGGVYKTYNYGVTWHQVGNQDLLVSCMAQDADGVIYVGTGDGGSAATYNGLDQQGYDNSFIGTGIYAIDAKNNDAMRQVVAPTADEWLFINDIAIAGNYLLASTNEGLKYSTDKGQTWQVAVEGVGGQIRIGKDNTIVAAVDQQIYIGSDVNNLVCHSNTAATAVSDSTGIILIPKANAVLDVAISTVLDSVTNTNHNVIYAGCINADGNHAGIYVSENNGTTWTVALPAVTNAQGHSVYGGYGTANHGLVIDPQNSGIVYVLGYYLWTITKPADDGYYITTQVTPDIYYYTLSYLHVGLHTMAFNPNNPQEFYVGTDGGVYKFGKVTGDSYGFLNCNRNYITSRMFNVGFSGKDTRVLAAGLDHGTVLIEGDENANNLGTGIWINPGGQNEGLYNEDAQAGPCAISCINPKTVFVTTKGGDHLYRSQTAGADWVSTNFTSSGSISISTSSFRLPILLYEKYDDALNPETVWFYAEEDYQSGATVQVMSKNNFPFNYTLTAPLANGDSIEVHDPVSAKFFVSLTDALYMTRTPLIFSVEAQWYKVADKAHAGFAGEPLSMAISADGDNMFVGMKNGKFFRVSNLNTVLDDATGSITDSLFQVTTTEITLPMSGQCVTSVAVDPRDPNKVIVTCGNYGNDNYVFYSTNALADEPVFVTKQANLPKMPVYSSLIERETGDVILGTERGIYRTDNINTPNWVADGQMMGEVPVMELKQQLLFHEDEQTMNVTDEGTFITDYPGVHNTGVIYAATYGRGVFRCENYKQDFISVPENQVVEQANVSMYPNPVCGQATLSFELKQSANVGYQVFDMMGRMVMNRNLGRMNEGSHQVNMNAENLSTGSYILRFTEGVSNTCVKFVVY